MQTTRHVVILHGLREVTSERQVISNDPAVTSMVFNGLKSQEMHNIYLLYNKTIVDLCVCRHGVLLNRKPHIDRRGAQHKSIIVYKYI